MVEDKLTLAENDPQNPVIVAFYETQVEHRELDMHSHPRGQLSGLHKGLFTVGTETKSWVVAGENAIWLPPQQPHYGYSHGSMEGWICYIAPSACTRLPDYPCAMNVSGLLREAVIRASAWQGQQMDESQLRIAQIILDELQVASIQPFGLTMPYDPRVRRVAQALLDNPADQRSLAQWALWGGISQRSLSRRFVSETGYTYTVWRQRARLMRALELLAGGASVTQVAFDLGYDSVSAFIALFKRTLGLTPSAYFSDN